MAFQSEVEDWRGDFADDGSHGGTEFLLAWAQKESAGNPCSWTKYQESGIFQLEPPDNMTQAGTTLAEQHPIPPCVAGAETYANRASLTPDQVNAQVGASLRFVAYSADQVRSLLAQYGSDPWDESLPDFWQMVKYHHALPGAQRDILRMASGVIGHPVQSWDDFVTVAKATNCGGHACGTTITNATAVGAYGSNTGAGGDPSIFDQMVVLAGPPRSLSGKEILLGSLAAIGAFFAARKAARYLFGTTTL